MTSWTTPTPEQIEKAIALLAQPEQRRYFFDRLNNPHWLEPLREKGFFKNPPAIVRDEEKKTVGFPPWPESRYLARMAKHDPAKVLEIAILVETDNIYVQEDFVDAALAMPAEMAAKLVPKVFSWMKSPYSAFWPEKFGELVSHLAKGNQVDHSLSLAKALLAVLPSEKGLLSQAKARFDAWHYERILEKNIPDLIEAAGVRGFALLGDLLESAVKLSVDAEGDEGGEDYSYIWRGAIEGAKHRGFHEIRDLLVSAVRDAAVKIVGADRPLATPIIDSLERRPWKIFDRMALHVLRSFPDGELVRSRLTNSRLFLDRGVQREYALLLRDRFDSLPAGSQGEILSWIQQGPDLDKFRESRNSWGEHPPTEQESEQYAEVWRLRRLRWIRDSLPAEWRQKYDALVRQYGEPEDPEIVPRTEAVWTGPRTPKGEKELRAMSVSDVLAYLKEWHPPEDADPRAPSIEGLGRQLRSLVASKPSGFVQEVSNFRDLDPTYARALLEGLHDAVGKSSFAWDPVMSFCQWIIAQPRTIEGRAVKKWDADRDWGPTRAVLGRLLSAGFQERESEIPLSLRDQAWRVLRELTDDPEPTPQYEKEFGGQNMDPVTMSINTVRGEAMHTVVRYALWLRCHIAKAEHAQERLAQGFGEMPEVKEVLEAHLDHAHDPSLAIRAVYGEWLPWLNLLDRGWAANNLSKILPADAEQRDLRDAAWEAYIVFCQPYNDAFDVMKGEYVRAVDRIGTVAAGRRHHGDPDQHLAEHLMVFYWRGKLDLNEAAGLLKSFYEKASDSLRGHAIEFIGRSLNNTEGRLEAEVLERLTSLWDLRLDVARRSPTGTHSREMSAFGWWFASGKLDESWALDQLHAALSLSHKIDADWLVLERLETLAQTMPQKVGQCIELMIEGDLEGWEIHGWRDELRKILAVIIRGDNRVARDTAVKVVNRLGAKGHFEFRNLLPPSALN